MSSGGTGKFGSGVLYVVKVDVNCICTGVLSPQHIIGFGWGGEAIVRGSVRPLINISIPCSAVYYSHRERIMHLPNNSCYVRSEPF